MILKISSGQTLTENLNVSCDFDRSNPVFLLDTLAYDDQPSK